MFPLSLCGNLDGPGGRLRLHPSGLWRQPNLKLWANGVVHRVSFRGAPLTSEIKRLLCKPVLPDHLPERRSWLSTLTGTLTPDVIAAQAQEHAHKTWSARPAVDGSSLLLCQVPESSPVA